MNAIVSKKARFLALSLATVALLVAGCGDGGIKKITVNGTVTLKGQPVRAGILTFVGEGYYGAANLNPDGTYTMTDVVPGEVKVSLMESPSGSGSSSGEKTAPAPKPTPIPEKYRTVEKSGLKYTITPSTTNLKIELE